VPDTLFGRSPTKRRASRAIDRPEHADGASAMSGGVLPEAVLGPLNEEEQRFKPAELYLAGDRTLLLRRPKVSIVGSRNASEEGLRRAARLARLLVSRDAVVVSGLALGVDTAAHRAAITAGGRTIAVIGTPLDKVYPRENSDLQRLIAQEHLLVSQFPVGHPTTRASFPMRNRTMALIVDASVIVEAGDTSGSLSQGWEALRLARTLFIMKSVADRPDLKWPRQMLNYGAQILNDPEDLLEALPYGDPAALVSA
jgi:DNA processing protein